MRARPFTLALALCLGGCAAGSQPPTTISTAIADVEADLARVNVVSVSDVRSWSPEEGAAFSANAHALQCAQNTADPVVSMIAGPVALNLSGTFTQSGSFSISAGGTLPTFGLQADASRAHTQQLGLPVQFVPLSALPDAEMQRAVAYAGALLAQPDQTRTSVAANILADRDALAAHIRPIVAHFGSLCPVEPGRPFVGRGPV